MISRRVFLKISALAGGAVMLPFPLRWLGPKNAYAFSQTPTLSKFGSGQLLPSLLDPAYVAQADVGAYAGSDYYRMVAQEYTQQMHPDLPPTKLWGYADETNGAPANKYLGPTIVATSGKPVRITMRNNLPATHPLPVDELPDMSMPEELGHHNRISVHLHGGFVPWISDGGPFAWFGPAADNNYGQSIKDNSGKIYSIPDMPVPAPGSLHYYYPNQQSCRLMWYHDHAHNLTRLNAYAGLAAGYFVADNVMTRLISQKLIPGLAYTVPVVLQDKSFNNDGTLWYPSVYEGPANGQPLPTTFTPPLDPPGANTGRWDTQPQPPAGNPAQALPLPSAVPEFFADTIVINGMCYPVLEVEPRNYRFLFLNGSQARFYNLQLHRTDISSSDVALGNFGSEVDPNGLPIKAPTTSLGPVMTQIGSEGGFLPFPAAFNTAVSPVLFDLAGTPATNPTWGNARSFNLLLAPAERADVLIDFTGYNPGETLMLCNDAPGPFPGGDPRNDYYYGQPDWTPLNGSAGPASKGVGPNTRTLMLLRVKPRVGSSDPPSMSLIRKVALGQLPSSMNPLPPLQNLRPIDAIKTRILTLNEDFDANGRLEQMLGTNVVVALSGTRPSGSYVMDPVTFSQGYMDPSSENPKAGTTEIWKIVNRTADTHPIHFHLINAQVISRQAIDIGAFNTAAAAAGVGAAVDPTPYLLGAPRGPDNNEKGWKETIRMNPGEITTVIKKFDLPRTPFAVPLSPSPTLGVRGYEYVWHCHILEHEEHDMMRPLVVQP